MNWPLIAAVAFLVLVYTLLVVTMTITLRLAQRIETALRPKDSDEDRRR